MKWLKVFFVTLIVIFLLLGVTFIYEGNSMLEESSDEKEESSIIMDKLLKVSDIDDFKKNYPNIEVNIRYSYDEEIKEDMVIYQSIEEGNNVIHYEELEVVISLGSFNKEKASNDKINELGKIPIMMYHGILDMKSSDTSYIGGNVDKDGYTRTSEAFRNDLEFYYNNGYRMIRLIDYINGDIDVQYGKSPIVLTFDDGNDNNIKVLGLDDKGDIIIDPNSAVGILEEFKKKYPDFKVTATFFVNDTLFNQPEYDVKILDWLVNNGYDIGNHTRGHINIKDTSYDKVSESVGYVYNQLDGIIPNKYVNIVALPFGSPYKKEHDNFSAVLNSNYNGKSYESISTLRVGWDSEESPYSSSFDKSFLKRCRAYDNEGREFDITMVFNNLLKTRYVSDGSRDTIVISCKDLR